jgi:tetraacyldisaccharide 4'-kinase
MTARDGLERTLTRAWTRRGPLAWALRPLSWLYAAGNAARSGLYRSGICRPLRVGLPVVVVGNLYVGGAGKTPLVIALAQELKARGWRPGVISRGYGRRTAEVRPVEATSRAADVGDEPLLIAQRANVPVVVGADRVAAARVLHSLNPRCDLVVCDDGLQHPHLHRDVEIAVLHFRGLGNGWLLPAGPLRDPPRRLQSVDAVVLNGDVPAVRVDRPLFRMTNELDQVYALADPRRRAPLSVLAQEQQTKGLRVAAAAGIAAPEQFFAALRAAGLEVEAIALPDHFDYVRNPFAGRGYDVALVTEKDAVKCRANAALAADGRLCAVSLRTRIEPGLVDLVEAKIGRRASATETATDGPSPA